MADPARPWDPLTLLAGVRLTDDPALASELVQRLPPPGEPRTASVTEVLDPRRAFWRRLRGPAPVPLERELRVERGRAWHRRLGDAVASEGRLEVRLRRAGLSARIDLLADVPVEIKTRALAPNGAPPEDWPNQVEQLAAYCALAGHDRGRLVHLGLQDDRPPTVSVGELRFRGLSGVLETLRATASELKEAVAVGRPGRLPRCRWVDRGCEYRAAGLCDCRGDEPLGPSSVLGHAEGRTDRPEIAERWTAALAAGPTPAPAPPAHFRDLLYPRRAYFDRTTGRPPVAHPSRPPTAPADAYERTMAALEGGPVGEVHRLPAAPDAPEEEVLGWRGAPCLVRSSRVRARLTADEVAGRFPQYLLDLGFRCAVSGTARATLVVGYDPPAPGELPVQVFRLELPGGAAPFAGAWTARREALELAISRGAPEGLAACPAWMTTTCPYADRCGCAAAAGRSQR